MWRDKDGVSLRESARRRRGLPDGGEWGEGRSLGTGGREGGILCEQSERTCCLHLGTHLQCVPLRYKENGPGLLMLGAGRAGCRSTSLSKTRIYIPVPTRNSLALICWAGTVWYV